MLYLDDYTLHTFLHVSINNASGKAQAFLVINVHSVSVVPQVFGLLIVF